MKLRVPAIAVSVLLASSCARPSAPYPPVRSVATVEEIMEAIVAPSAEAVFDSAVWTNGVPDGIPTNEAEWEAIEHRALALAESGNLLMFEPRAPDQGDWIRMTQAMMDAAVQAAKAAKAQDLDAILVSGDAIYKSCLGCHRQYIPNFER